MNWKLTDGFFGWVIKIGTLIVNAPATFGLAYAAFATIGDNQALPEPLRVLVAIAAVVLLEGILIKSWARLDAERAKQAPDPAEEFRHAFKAVAMYFALLAVAFLHGEGLAGIVFRLAFGIELGIAAWDSIAREIKRASASTKAGSRDWVVEGVQRRLMRRTNVYELRKFWGQAGVERFRRDQDALIERTRIKMDAITQLAELSPEALTEIDRAALWDGMVEESSDASPSDGGHHPTLEPGAVPVEATTLSFKRDAESEGDQPGFLSKNGKHPVNSQQAQLLGLDDLPF